MDTSNLASNNKEIQSEEEHQKIQMVSLQATEINKIVLLYLGNWCWSVWRA